VHIWRFRTISESVLTGPVQVSRRTRLFFKKSAFDTLNLFDSRPHIAQAMCGRHPQKENPHTCVRVFFLGVPIGNRTRIAGTTNLSVNRYTIGTILDCCDYDITRRTVMRTAALARGRPSLCAGEDLNLHTIAGTTTSR
jgi:hypothetical protein